VRHLMKPLAFPDSLPSLAIAKSFSVIMPMPNDLVKEYQSKLVGKTVSSKESTTVSHLEYFTCLTAKEFPKSKLPPKHRIVVPGGLVTRDFHEDR
jgi:hypothetical protein